MATRVFNYRKLYDDLNRARKARGIAWNKVATRAGVAPTGLNMFTRQFEDSTAQTPKGLSVENLVKLLEWLNKTDLAPYLVDEDDPDVTV